MTPDPGKMFGNLLRSCISDRYEKSRGGIAAEDILFLALGLGSSIATTYLLSLAGILV